MGPRSNCCTTRTAHDPDVKHLVYAAADLDVRGIAELNVRLGETFAAACLAALDEASIAPAEVDLIGSHGQTIYHHSGVAGALRATLQVGDGDIIAVRTGRYVISDFRARDIAAERRGCAAFAGGRRHPVRQSGAGKRTPCAVAESRGDCQSHRARPGSGAGLRFRHRACECTARPAGAHSLRGRIRL